MKSTLDILEQRISVVMVEVTGQQGGCAALVRPATDPRFGDYQVNGVMALAKQIKTNPRKLAEQIVAKLDIGDICEKPEVAGPGFINLRLKPDFIAANLLQVSKDPDRLGIEKEPKPKTIVVDFSGPNIAKQMHVGHLRSTIIGDCICRLLEFEGHKVIRQNHIGDWGTALGKVILGLWHWCMAEKHGGKPYYENELEELKVYAHDKQKLRNICNRICRRNEEDWEEDFIDERGDGKKRFRPFLEDLKKREKSEIWEKTTVLYQYVNLLEDSLVGMKLMNPTRKKKKSYRTEERFEYISIQYENLSRHITAMLQNIDDKDNEQEKIAWERVREISLEYCYAIYKTLNVNLTEEHTRGESFYRDMLPDVVDFLLNNEDVKAEKSEGAICIFPDKEKFKTKDGEPLPFIIQKSDEAYLYATTDLAAIRYRVTNIEYKGGKYKADEIIYITDARQSLHFQMLFKVSEMAGWAKREILHHVIFGSVLGEDGKPLKTRSGENVKLKELLDEAVERAHKIVDEKNPELSKQEKEKIANAVGIGAVKYADYSNNRTSDYIFSFDKMLAMEGNTAPYMQYAYARIRSIERKGQSRNIDIETELAGIKTLNLTETDEINLAKHLIRYGEAVHSAVGDYRPNYLTAYLYDLAQKFSGFYTNCPVLDASPDKRPTRLLLCDLTARTIEHGLHNILGIEVIEQM
jgi:arginyl-tRNA synthetase